MKRKEYMYKTVIKAGRLSNGFELGKGKVVHLADNDYIALCGSKPAITFTEVSRDISCAKCLKLKKELGNT
jgi:hypothetical protein